MELPVWDLNALGRNARELAVGEGRPGRWPRRPRWLVRYGQPVLLALTFGLILIARANAMRSGVLTQLVAVVGVLPVALLVARPLLAWRIGWLAGALAVLAPVPGATAWPWHPIQVLVMLPVLLVVATTQRASVTLGVWVATMVLVLVAADPKNQPGIAILITLIVVAGDQVRRRRSAQGRLVEQEERSAVLAERARIARELHDVVAHHMSLIAVRAETAPYRLRELPGPARDEFVQISTAARQALTEMRRLLGVLRSERQEVPVAPQPGLADLPELVAAARLAGASVELDMPAPDACGCPPGVGLTAYRIVQEALSNATRHAPGEPVTVTIGRGPADLTVIVANPTRDRSTPVRPAAAGHGLLGMRERATMLGGTLTARREEGGFVVHAVLPLAETPG